MFSSSWMVQKPCSSATMMTNGFRASELSFSSVKQKSKLQGNVQYDNIYMELKNLKQQRT